MRRRNRKSLAAEDASVIKAMLNRGDPQHDIASYFGVNGGRIAEIAKGMKFSYVLPYHGNLPPQGPYDFRSLIEASEILARDKEIVDEIVAACAEIEKLLPKNVNIEHTLQRFLRCAQRLEG